jgi:hypothetical protein
MGFSPASFTGSEVNAANPISDILKKMRRDWLIEENELYNYLLELHSIINRQKKN